MPLNGHCKTCTWSYVLKIGREIHLSGNFILTLQEWEQVVSFESHKEWNFSGEGHNSHVASTWLPGLCCLRQCGSKWTFWLANSTGHVRMKEQSLRLWSLLAQTKGLVTPCPRALARGLGGKQGARSEPTKAKTEVDVPILTWLKWTCYLKEYSHQFSEHRIRYRPHNGHLKALKWGAFLFTHQPWHPK